MVLRRLQRLARPICLTTTAALLLGPLAPGILQAQDRSAAIGRVRVNSNAAAAEQAAAQRPPAAQISLHYIAASWPKVLEQVAAAAGLTLVMHDVPPGNFTRNDFHKHPLEEAVRILNRDLEPLGFRVLANAQFFTVIRAERARPEYPRRETTRRATGAGALSAGGVQTADYEASEPSRDAIVRTAEEQPATETVRSDSTPSGIRYGTSERLTPQNRPAKEISRDIFAAFEARATVQERGPHGLPAFVVWRDAGPEAVGNLAPEQRGGEWFTFELDTDANAVVITGDKSVAAGVSELVRRIDAVPRTEGETTRLVAGDKDLPAIGKQLRPQIEKLKGNGAPAPRRVAWQPDGQPLPADQPSEAAPPPGGDNLQNGVGALMGNLRGDVQIQSVDDLNLLIVRGNEADVNQVLEVISLIERVAQGSQPEIRLLNLTHVSSEALATLLEDVYERLADQQEGQGRTPPTINVVPVVQPNAILILAPEAAMESILLLAEELDKPADPAAEVHVYRLKHAIASQVVTLLEDFYEDRPGLGTRVRAIADARTNSIIIQARPRELQEVELLIKQVDKDSTGASHQARVFPLQHASATELAEFLTTALQNVINPSTTTQQGGGGGGAGQNSQQLRDTKSVVLEFLQSNGDIQRLVKSGLLTDIRVNGDPRTNTVLVTGPKDSLPMMEAMIQALDQPSRAVASVKMIPLQNTSAVGAIDLLTELFAPTQEDELGVQLAGAESASSLVPLRFQADARSNTVIAYGSEEALTMVEAILLRLDAGDLRDRKTEVIKLRNAPAADAASAINTFLQSQRDLLTLDSDLVSTFELLEQEVIVTPEPVNNYLLISATPKYYDRIMAMVRQLDSDPPQVMIQALLVEVELDDTDEFGVELGFQDPLLFARSFTGSDEITTTTTTTTTNNVTTTATNVISQSATPGFNFNSGNPLGNNIAATPATVAAQALGNFALGRTNADLGFGGLVLAASSQSVSVLIRALASRRNVRVLSRPQVIALDGQEASIQVGQEVPIVNGVTTTAIGTANPNVTYDEAGIILTVQPRISPEGQIVMVVAAEKSAYTDTGVPIYTDTAGNTFTSPTKNVTTASTTVKIPDGQTIVVGGMITKTDLTIERKVPFLGDIPIVKTLFRYDSHTEKRTELLIFLTPRVIRGDGDTELIKQVEADRLHFFEEEAEAIHGPLFGVPPEDYGLPIIDGQWSRDGSMPIPDAVFTEPNPAPGMLPGPYGSIGPTPLRNGS